MSTPTAVSALSPGLLPYRCSPGTPPSTSHPSQGVRAVLLRLGHGSGHGLRRLGTAPTQPPTAPQFPRERLHASVVAFPDLTRRTIAMITVAAFRPDRRRSNGGEGAPRFRREAVPLGASVCAARLTMGGRSPTTLQIPGRSCRAVDGSPDHSFSHALRWIARSGSPCSPRVPGISPDGLNGVGYRGATALPDRDLCIRQLWLMKRDIRKG
jgi:hypothetical protein